MRANILSILSIDLKHQTFTCVFFLDSSWVDFGLKGTGHGVAVQSINSELTNQVRVRRLHVCAPRARRCALGTTHVARNPSTLRLRFIDAVPCCGRSTRSGKAT